MRTGPALCADAAPAAARSVAAIARLRASASPNGLPDRRIVRSRRTTCECRNTGSLPRCRKMVDIRAPRRRRRAAELGERPMPDSLSQAREDVAVANRILAHEGLLDAFGHVSI